MCSATLLPEPDNPLRMMMRTAQWSSSRPRARKSLALGGGRCGRRPSHAQRPAPLDGVVIGALFLVLLDAAIELVGEQVDRGVHVLFGRVRVDVVAAHVQGRLGLLPQLLDG